MKKLIIAISSLILLSATNAMSMDFKPSIGISGSAGVFAATGIENNFNEGGTAIAETTKEYGAFQADMASIFVEIGLNLEFIVRFLKKLFFITKYWYVL